MAAESEATGAALQPWQRPPFEAGHELSLQHGAYSPRKVEPLAGEIVEGLLADPQCGHLRAPRFRHELWALARAEAQVQLLTEYLSNLADQLHEEDPGRGGVGDLDADRVRSAYLLLHRAESRAHRARQSLGLSPLAAARLGRDVAAGELDMARLMAEMDKRDRQREQEAK